jgi:hypothetical protein
MPIGCLIPQFVDKFKAAISSGKIDPDVLMNSTSSERRTVLEDIVGKENVHDVNSLIESKLLLVNQKQGILNAIKKLGGISTADAETLAKNAQTKLDRINEYMNPAKQDKFLADLAQDKVSRQFKLDITPEETKTIVESTRVIDAAKTKIPESSPIGSEERLDYGLKKVIFDDYIANLKLDANKTTFKEYLTNPAKASGDAVDLVAGTLKSAVASLDNSLFGRQGIKTLFTNPDIWGKTFIQSWKNIGNQLIAKGKWWTSGDDAVMQSIKADIVSRPNAINGKYKAQGFDLGIGSEEAFPTSLPEKVPLFGRLFKSSETAYNGAALRMRADLADRVLEGAEKAGVDVMDKEANLGSMVNSLTGRGNLGKLSGLGKETNVLFFSIKFLKSNIDTLYDGLRSMPKLLSKAPEDFVSRQNALNLLKIVGGMATILGTAKLLHPDSVEFDPRSTKFGKIKVGQTTFDISGGMASLVTLASRLVPTDGPEGWGFYTRNSNGQLTKLNSGKYGSQTAWDVLDSFAQGKLSPAAGMLRDIWKGQDYNGNKPTLISLAKNSATPMMVQNYEDTKKNPDSANVLSIMILDGLGISASTYGSTQSSLNKMLPNTPPELTKEFDRLQKTGNKPSLSDFQTNPSVTEIKKQLSPDQYLKFTQTLQNNYQKQITSTINSIDYKKLTDTAEKDKLDSVKAKSIDDALKQFKYKKAKAPSKYR